MPASRITDRILVLPALLTLLGAALFLSPAATPQTPGIDHDSAPASGPLIVGRLVDADERPLADATVALLPPSWPERFQEAWRLDGREPAPEADTRTDSQGLFRLRAPAPGLWRLRYDAPGHGRAEQLALVALEWQEVKPPIPPSSRVVSLTVRDPSGQPVAGARVLLRTLTPPEPEEPHRTAWLRDPQRPVSALHGGLTDGQGRIDLPVAKGVTEVAVVPDAPWRPISWRPVSRRQNTLTLEPSVERSVAVADPRGEPVVGARIAFAGPLDDSEPNAPVLFLGTSDAEGRWTGSWPRAAGRLVAETGSPDRVLQRAAIRLEPPGPVDAERESQPPETLVLTLKAPPRAGGRVLDASTQRPLEGALVWAPRLGAVAATTTRDGSFELPLPRNGDLPESGGSRGDVPVIWALLNGYLAELERLTTEAPLRNGAPWRVPSFAMKPATLVAGRIVDSNGTPVAGARVETGTNPWQRRPGQRTLSAHDGTFVLAGLALLGIAERLEVKAAGYAPLSHQLHDVSPGARRTGLRLVLRRGIGAAGRVVGPGDEPVVDARVRLVPSAPSANRQALHRLLSRRNAVDQPSALTDPQGAFRLEHLAEGNYDLLVEADGHAPAQVPGLELVAQAPTPEDGGLVDLGTVVLERSARASGRVVDTAGVPVAGASVEGQTDESLRGGFSMMLDHRSREPSSTTTDDDGRFELGDFQPADTIKLTVESSGFAPHVAPGVEVPTEEPLEIVLEKAARITGRVVDTDGEPVSGARVNAWREGVRGSLNDTSTDERGDFALGELPSGSLTLVARAEGFVASASLHLEVTPGERREGVQLTLERGVTVVGSVTGADGEPVPGARVRLTPGHPGSESSRAYGRTDGEGRYRLEGVAPGKRSFQVETFKHPPAVQDLEVRPGENRLDFRLEEGQVIQGRVLDPDGLPVAGVEVTVMPVQRRVSSRSERTDPRGEFEVGGLGDGRYGVHATHETLGVVGLEEQLVLEGHGASGVELRFEPAATVHGRILGLSLDQLSQVNVRAHSLDGPGATLWAKPDYEGRFTLQGASPGPWRIRASLASGRQVTEKLEITEGQREAEVTLEFTDGLTLSGRVLMTGEPLVGLYVLVVAERPNEPPSPSGSATTDHQGRFRLKGLSEGTYGLLIRGRSTIQHQETIELSRDRDVLIELEGGRIRGRVLDAQSLEPLAGASIRSIDESASRSLGRSSSDVQGRFRLDHLPPGDILLRVSREGYGETRTTVPLESGGTAEGVEIQLQPTRGVDLRITFAGVPGNRVNVVVTDHDGAVAMNRSLGLGEGGSTRLDTLPEGSWLLHVGSSGYASVAVPATSPGPTVAVHLPLPATLEIMVPALAETRTEGLLQVFDAVGHPFVDAETRGRPRRIFGGAATVRNLPPGTWRVQVTANGQRWTGSATVTTGETARVELR